MNGLKMTGRRRWTLAGFGKGRGEPRPSLICPNSIRYDNAYRVATDADLLGR